MVRRWFSMLALLLLAALLVAPARAQDPERASKAVTWVRTQQQADGSFAGFGLGSSADAVYAMVAANLNADDASVKRVIGFIETHASKIAADPGLAAKYVLAASMLGRTPRNVAGVDVVAGVVKGYNPAKGQYGADVTSHALAILALVAAGAPVEPAALSTLVAFQLEDGSWSFSGDRTPKAGDTNSTALALHALVALKPQDRTAIDKGLAYLKTQRNADGGFPYSQASSFGTASDANSTSLVIQAIVVTGGNPTVAPWADAQGNPLAALLTLQNASGAFRYNAATPDDNTLATYQAIPALMLKPFPTSALIVAQPDAPTATIAGAPTPTSQPIPTATQVGAPTLTSVPVPTGTLTGAPAPTRVPAPTATRPAPTPGVPATLPETSSQSTSPLLFVAASVLIMLGLVIARRRAA